MDRSEEKMSGGQDLQLPPGFRFHPTDEELVVHYLCRRCAGLPIAVPIIAEVDLYKFDPWEVPRMALYGEKEWYFFSPRDRKYPNGSRPNRAAGSGYWKATGADKPVGSPKPVAIKKALVFYAGKAPKGEKTNWIMHEYRLADVDRSARKNNSLRLDDGVLCRIYNKKGGLQKPTAPAIADRKPVVGSQAAAVSSPPEQKPAVGLAPGVVPPPAFPDFAAYNDRPSDSMPRLHADSSCSEQVLSSEFAGERGEVQSQPKISEWERTFATAGPVNPAAGSMLDPNGAGGLGCDPLLQDILIWASRRRRRDDWRTRSSTPVSMPMSMYSVIGAGDDHATPEGGAATPVALSPLPPPPQMVVVALDATRDHREEEVRTALRALVARGDILRGGHFLVVLHATTNPMGYQTKACTDSFAGMSSRYLSDQVATKAECYRGKLRHDVEELCRVGISVTLKVSPGSPAKVVIIQEVNSSKAAWVVLDRW